MNFTKTLLVLSALLTLPVAYTFADSGRGGGDDNRGRNHDEGFETEIEHGVATQVRHGGDRIRIEHREIERGTEIKHRDRGGRDHNEDEHRIELKFEHGALISGTVIPSVVDDTQASSSLGLTKVDVEFFTNETVVTIELNDVKTSFDTQAVGLDTIIDEIMSRYDVTPAQIFSVITFSIEDRASRASDKAA